jgi:hypothetical protein
MPDHYVCVTPEYERYAADAAVLAEIGRAVFPQPTRLRVRLPRALADLAVAAWAREEDNVPPGEETPEQITARRRAGTLGLIGLNVESAGGGTPAGDDVLADLDAWEIGSAFDAAEDAGLLADLRQPDLDSTAASGSGQPVHLYAVLQIDLYISAAEPGGRPAASTGPFRLEVVVKEVLPTAELASNEVRRLNALNQDERCTYIWQVARYYASGRRA